MEDKIKTIQALVLELDQQKYVLDILSITRVVPLVEITSIPGTQDPIEGVIDFQGSVIPIFSLRKLLGLKAKEESLSDKIIIMQCHSTLLGLLSDDIQGVKQFPVDAISKEGLPQLVEGAIRRENEIIFLLTGEKLVEEKLLESIGNSLKVVENVSK